MCESKPCTSQGPLTDLFRAGYERVRAKLIDGELRDELLVLCAAPALAMPVAHRQHTVAWIS